MVYRTDTATGCSTGGMGLQHGGIDMENRLQHWGYRYGEQAAKQGYMYGERLQHGGMDKTSGTSIEAEAEPWR